jgi:hypothetical protein
MDNFLDATHRTFALNFKTSRSPIIFQNEYQLQQALTLAIAEGHLFVDINKLQELNRFNRFVKINDMPEWLLLTVSNHIQYLFNNSSHD